MSMPDTFLPLLFKVRWHEFDPTATNDLGNKVEAWKPPVERLVYGWGPPQLQAPKEVLVGTNRFVVNLELMVPPNWGPIKDGDKIQLDDDSWWRVVGPKEDYEHNPFGWNPGSVVNLVMVKGVK